jgi:hypothetical protein
MKAAVRWRGVAPDPAVAVPLYLLAVAVGVPLSFALSIAIGKARVAADVRRHGGKVGSIRYVWTPYVFRTRRAGFHVDLVDGQGRAHRVRAYPYWGKVFWREGQQTFSVLDVLKGAALDAEWWRTPFSGPPGPQPGQWLPADSPPTVRRNRMWYVPVAFGAFFLLSSLLSLSVSAGLALVSGSWWPLALPVFTALVGAGLIAFGLRLRR